MASITLDCVCLHEAADLANTQTFQSKAPRTFQQEKQGEVRAYGSRLRIVTRPVRRRTIPITFIGVTDYQYDWLEDLAGDDMLFRDSWGQLLYVTYFLANVEQHLTVDDDVALTLQQVSYTPVIA